MDSTQITDRFERDLQRRHEAPLAQPLRLPLRLPVRLPVALTPTLSAGLRRLRQLRLRLPAPRVR